MLRLEEKSEIKSAANNCSPAVAGESWHWKETSRYRRNVLDLLEIFGKKALTSYLFCDIDMSQVETLRQEFASSGQRVTITAFLLRAICLAQKSFPESRTFCFPGGRLVTFENIVAGFTVEREIEGVPIVFFGEIEAAHKKSLDQLTADLERYAHADIAQLPKLRQQKLFAEMPALLRWLILSLSYWFPAFRLKCMGATFGFSSLGSLGVSAATGPSVCTSVFGVGALVNRAVVKENKLTIKPMLTLSLSFDQRALNAGTAARFLAKVKELIERPTLCVES